MTEQVNRLISNLAKDTEQQVKVIKRDGRIVPFSHSKIYNAIEKAFIGMKETVAQSVISEITYSVLENLHFNDEEKKMFTIEGIQDEVEKQLMKKYPEVAKAYILYREERSKQREKQTPLMKTLEEISYTETAESDLKRENANINSDTAMGSMLKYGSESIKRFILLNILPKDIAKAHIEGDIHIHDLDFYLLTETCCQIDLLKLFHGGFTTGHGYIREPNSITAYASLACIAIQSNQNDQHGGQAIPNFDYAMSEGVKKTFVKEYIKTLKDFIWLVLDIDEKDSEYLKENKKRTQEKVNIGLEKVKNALTEAIKNGKTIIDKKEEIIEKTLIYVSEGFEESVDGIYGKEVIDYVWKLAIKHTEQQTYQAMEALIHNLNTMHSRAGAQVPFSSLNYGMCTEPEARMAVKNLLLATEAGLGNGETPIFPIQIFRVKEGINYNEGEPNYDLFKLAMRVSAKRLFPNFSFVDAPFNKQYYKEGRPETEIAYMGCVQGSEVIRYKVNGKKYVEGIKRAYTRINTLAGAHKYGESMYMDTSELDVEIFDTYKGGYTKVRKFIMNPNKNNWYRIKFSNGRSLIATADHPLPIKGKGRTYVRDIEIDDVAYSADKVVSHSENVPDFSKNVAWLLGVILCDASYRNNITISLGFNERDILAKVEEAVKEIGGEVTVIEQHRGKKGDYIDVNIKLGKNLKPFRTYLTDLFGGVKKAERSIPSEVFEWRYDYKSAFIAGMIDADGYINHHRDRRVNDTCYIQTGSTNKELALQLCLLVESLGFDCKYYMNHYNGSEKVRYMLHFKPIASIIDEMVSQKKVQVAKTIKAAEVKVTKQIVVIEKEPIVLDECSFDVETESDRFDVSGIMSHNCRTRVIGNNYDPEREICPGRGNLSFTTINLPRLGILAKGDLNKFYEMLKERMDLCKQQLLHRFSIQCQKKVKNYPFLMGNGVWIDSDKLTAEDSVAEVLKHGTFSIGFIGLAETLKALIGVHHGESEEAQKLGLEIISYMRRLTDQYSEDTGLNFTLFATPAEGLSGRFIRIDKKKFGEIEGITDKDYYTNSFHVPVYYPISAYNKISIEAPYHALTNAGHISYVELDGDPLKNLPAFEAIIRCMHDKGIGYGSVNHPVDRDPVCGYVGIINDVCPRCGRREGEGVSIEKLNELRKLYPNMPRFCGCE